VSVPEPFLEPLEPRRGHPPRLRRDFAVASSGATAPMPDRRLLDLGRLSKIWRSRFNYARSNLNRLMQIQQLSLLPSPAPLWLGSAC
jgi:hypothetical protein